MLESRAKPTRKHSKIDTLKREPGSLQEATFIAHLQTQRAYRALLELGVRPNQFEELAWRVNRLQAAERLARHQKALGAAVGAMQRLLALGGELRRHATRLGSIRTWQGAAISVDPWSQVEAWLCLSELTHNEIVDCLQTLTDALPEGLAQRLDRAAHNIEAQTKSLPELPKTGSPRRVGENLFIYHAAALCRRATGTPNDALCCDLYKFVFGYHAIGETTYQTRRWRLESAAC